jgi:hypothetical protein
MDVTLKYKIIEKLVKLEDETVLQQIEEILKLSETDFWKSINPKLKDSLLRALNQSDEGEGLPHEEVLNNIKSSGRA